MSHNLHPDSPMLRRSNTADHGTNTPVAAANTVHDNAARKRSRDSPSKEEELRHQAHEAALQRTVSYQDSLYSEASVGSKKLRVQDDGQQEDARTGSDEDEVIAMMRQHDMFYDSPTLSSSAESKEYSSMNAVLKSAHFQRLHRKALTELQEKKVASASTPALLDPKPQHM